MPLALVYAALIWLAATSVLAAAFLVYGEVVDWRWRRELRRRRDRRHEEVVR